MASPSPSPSNNDELPVIWLLPPDAVSPSSHPIAIYPLPIAISATLASLIILILVVLYHRKPNHANAPHHGAGLAPLKSDIRVIRRETTQLPQIPHTVAYNHVSMAVNEPESARPNVRITAPDEDSASITPSLDTIPMHDYHDYLRNSIYVPSLRNTAAIWPRHSSGQSTPSQQGEAKAHRYSTNGSIVKAPQPRPIRAPVGSDYSVSIDPTPLPSRQNSFRRSHGPVPWSRLRLGSQYDEDRTFVPSEANLRLGR